MGVLINLTDRISLLNIHLAREDYASRPRDSLSENDLANRINNLLLEKLLTEHMSYKCLDSEVEVKDAVHYPAEFLCTINIPGVPHHILYLKVGTPIVLLRNLNPPKLCSISRLQVKTVLKHVIKATLFTDISQVETVFIIQIPLILIILPLSVQMSAVSQ